MSKAMDTAVLAAMELNPEAFDVACEAGVEAARAGMEPAEELAECIKAYLWAAHLAERLK